MSEFWFAATVSKSLFIFFWCRRVSHIARAIWWESTKKINMEARHKVAAHLFAVVEAAAAAAAYRLGLHES